MIAVLGAGKRGEALMSGLLRAGVVSPAGVIAAARRSDRAEELKDAYGVEVLTAAEAARRAETLVITVKPQHMAGPRGAAHAPAASPKPSGAAPGGATPPPAWTGGPPATSLPPSG